LHSHAYALPAWYGLLLTGVVCGTAFWKGGREERLVAGALVLCWIATILLRDPRWRGAQWGAFGVDIVFLLILTAVALRSRQYWPLAAAAFQLLAVVTHAARTLDSALGGWAYATAGIIWTQLVLVALATGVWGTWRSSRPATNDAPTADPGAMRR
jgi:hypothetical protein